MCHRCDSGKDSVRAERGAFLKFLHAAWRKNNQQQQASVGPLQRTSLINLTYEAILINDESTCTMSRLARDLFRAARSERKLFRSLYATIDDPARLRTLLFRTMQMETKTTHM